MNSMRILLLLAAGLVFHPQANAVEVGVAAKVGTLGYALELTGGITPHLNVRTGINTYNYSYSATEDDIKYDVDLKLSSTPVLLDWHPFQGRFRLSAGVLLNGNQLEFTATPATTYTIGDVTYAASDVGNLAAEITFKKSAPFVGLGWGNAVRANTRFNFNFDLGLVMQGSPEVEFTATGTLATDSTFQAELNKETAALEDELSGFKTYPLIALGLSYRF